MAYFPNGSSGERYQEQWCYRCVHDCGDDEPTCPVWFAHLCWNYDACNQADVKMLLEAMIPTKENGFPDKCRMFISTGDLPGQAKLFD